MVFPEDFLWGVSQSGFQFEMGNAGRIGVDVNSDWYVWVHNQRRIERGIVSGDFPDNGVDYWNRYREDHQNAESLGLNAYRLGIEWSRVCPNETRSIDVGIERDTDGTISKIEVDDLAIEKLDNVSNSNAVDHYREIIQDLRSRNFKIFICLNHFTLPLWIHNPIRTFYSKFKRIPKGWEDTDTIVEFTKYASYMAWKFGDITDNWITFNEPMLVAEAGYLSKETGFPPGIFDFKAATKVSTNIVIAHSHAYDAIKKWDTIFSEDESNTQNNVGIIHNPTPVTPFDAENKLDNKAAEYIDHTHNHLFLNAASEGWLDKNLDQKKEKGEIKKYLGNRLDFLGINYYTRNIVRGKKSLLARLFIGVPVVPEIVEGYGINCEPNSKSLDGLPTSDFGWEVYPKGIVEVLNIVKQYGVPLYITEHGIADEQDKLRSKFIKDHLKLLEEVVNQKKIDLRGYFHWALTDNYEWAEGFKMKFGLFSVDKTTKQRNMRKSALTLKKIINERKIND
jgi:beta-galactosidase